MKEWIASVEVDHVTYEIMSSLTGEVSFKAMTRDPKKFGIEDDSWEMPDVYVSYNTHGNCSEPVKVIRKICDVISKWVEKAKPEYFFFRSVDPKKLSLYMRLASRSSVFADYDCYAGEIEGVYAVNFVRK